MNTDDEDDEGVVGERRSKIVLILACFIMTIIYLMPIVIGLAFSSKPPLHYVPN